MKLFTGLFRAARKRLATHDTDMGSFRDTINELIAGKDGMSDEDVAAKVEALKEITNDLPESEDKSKLLRFIEDFKEVKSQDEATAKSAGDAVADLFEKLDTEAMKDAPEFDSPEAEATEPVETEVATEVVEETKEPTPEDGADEVEAAKEEICKDDDNSEYTLEEIYQFIKKRMAEDESCEVDQEEIQEDGADEIEGTEEVTEEEDMTTDHAPKIPVTLKSNANNSSLAAMFATIKNGGIR